MEMVTLPCNLYSKQNGLQCALVRPEAAELGQALRGLALLSAPPLMMGREREGENASRHHPLVRMLIAQCSK